MGMTYVKAFCFRRYVEWLWMLVVLAGFEPAHAGVKVLCLSAWP